MKQKQIARRKILNIVKKVFFIILSLLVLLLGISVIKSSLMNWVDVLYFQKLFSDPVKTMSISYILTELTMSGSPIAWVFVSVGEFIWLNQINLAAGVVGTRLWVNLLLFIMWFILFLRWKNLKKTMDIWVLQFLISFSITAVSIVFLILFLDNTYIHSFSHYVISNVSMVESYWLLGFVSSSADWIVKFIWNNVVWIILWFVLLVLWLICFDKSFSFINDKKSVEKLKTISTNFSSFLAGFFITSLSMSLSVSVTILLPLYTKGSIKKNHLIAYILWANITTLLDTVFLSIIAESSMWFSVILSFLISVWIVACLYMLWFKYYSRAILSFEEKILSNKIYFILFLFITLILPLFVLIF